MFDFATNCTKVIYNNYNATGINELTTFLQLFYNYLYIKSL